MSDDVAAVLAEMAMEDVKARLAVAMTAALEDRIVPGSCDCAGCGEAVAKAALAALTAAGIRCLYMPEGVDVAHGARLYSCGSDDGAIGHLHFEGTP